MLLEAVLVASMIFVTLYFVQGFDTVTYESTKEKNILFDKGLSALNSLDGYGESTEYESMLVRYLENNETSNFSNYIFNSIFPCISYRVYVHNISEMLLNNVPLNNTRDLWYKSNTPEVGRKSSVYKIYVYKGYVKEVVLDMWYL
jgi:hypothetical protein